MRQADSSQQPTCPDAFQEDRAGVHRKFSECSRFATCLAASARRGEFGPASAGGFRKPVAPSRQARCRAFLPPSSIVVALVAGAWLALAVWAARRGWRRAAEAAGGARRQCPARGAAAGRGRPCRWWSRPTARSAARSGWPARSGSMPAAALDGPVRRGGAVSDRGGGRARRASGRGAGRRAVQPGAAPGRARRGSSGSTAARRRRASPSARPCSGSST